MRKRLFAVALCAAFWVLSAQKMCGIGTSAASAILVDAASGQVLYQVQSQQQRLIASTTKLMTALVALESGHDLDEEVVIPADWKGVEGSSIYLKAGEHITLEALLYGTLLCSGNDAATVVAQFCGGTVENFVAEMNATAQRLGMQNSSFANPSGLDQEGHYSTAYDMTLLARACLDNQTLAQILSTKTARFGERIFTNHNKLLWRYEGCVGMKTGYTEKAGRTLVSAAQRDGMTLICVTLSDPNDWVDHAALYDFGFSNYKSQIAVHAGEMVTSVPVENSLLSFCPVVAEEDVAVCLKVGETITREVHLDCNEIQAPISAGTEVGEVSFWVNGIEVGATKLVTGVDIEDNLAPKRGLFQWLRGYLPES
ncbi:MAG: D-alanyl-D-alanine carboxypeptidase family protein [Lawsonibacter sp.]